MNIQALTGLTGTGDGGSGPPSKPAVIGNIVFLAAFGTALGLIGNEVSALSSWRPVLEPAFVGKTLIHLGTVVGAYVGGRLIPTGA